MRSALKVFAELFIKKRLAEGIDKSKFEIAIRVIIKSFAKKLERRRIL
jgi:hypothetical protein